MNDHFTLIRYAALPAEPLQAPVMRLPSQWPGAVRAATFGGALGHRCHMGSLAETIGPSRPRSTCLARLTQRGRQFAEQGSPWQHIHLHIDGLCREVFLHVVRIRVSEVPGNLLR